jgi:hypothetical protein
VPKTTCFRLKIWSKQIPIQALVRKEATEGSGKVGQMTLPDLFSPSVLAGVAVFWAQPNRKHAPERISTETD